MTLNSNALTSLSLVKSYLEIASGNTTQDTILEHFINAASDAIERYTNRKLKSLTITEYQDGRNQDRLLLHEYPASKPSAVYIDSSWNFDSSTAVDTTSYEIINESELILNSRNFPKGRRNIKIVYVAGYSTVPSALEQACLLYVENLYSMRGDRRNGINNKSKSGENISFIDGMTEQVKQLLEPFKRADFAHNQSMSNL